MQFISNKGEENKVEGDSHEKLKSMEDKAVFKCRNCNGNYWTPKCRYKRTFVIDGMQIKGCKLKRIDDKNAIKCHNCNGNHWTKKCRYKHAIIPGGRQVKQYKPKTMDDKGVVKCRNCHEGHWTSKCPYKGSVLAGGKVLDDMKPLLGLAMPSANTELDKPQGSKYGPSSMRGRGNKHCDSMQKPRNVTYAIQISNLSHYMTNDELKELVKPFGLTKKLFLAKDQKTNLCKGFAYAHFKFRAEAAMAISTLNGCGYDHLILNVDWSKPPAQKKLSCKMFWKNIGLRTS
ncbi:eukaryotic translation initiation factor 3 subunit G isoform X2 [Cephus cinctus]|uniref:Eukaryotic translation initiation factor 3 subunit G isoform X2 n=1 Tax=Cephus cinctus TaxID=211228 RepID=A0AAJ7FM10_CEPCN|nr:eukaryotic translation initiation factor 3 subunit G isoform X2 [Cephus cinctus]